MAPALLVRGLWLGKQYELASLDLAQAFAWELQASLASDLEPLASASVSGQTEPH